MSHSTENIEARLCAYVEGLLDEPQRREIEQALAANPRQRALVEDLRRTRRMLQDLPRQPAPPDLMDGLQGHIERSALLDESSPGESDVVLRISRWPQLTAIAAILILAAGLGLVVYLVLPTDGLTAFRLGRPATPPSGTVALATQDAELKPADGGVAGGGIRKSEEREAKSLARDPEGGWESKKPAAKDEKSFAEAGLKDSGDTPVPTTPPAPAPAPTPAPAPVVAHAKAGPEGAARGLSQQANAPVMVVVDAHNAADANSRVTEFLASNRISFSTLPESQLAQRNQLPDFAGEIAKENQRYRQGAQPGPARPEAPPGASRSTHASKLSGDGVVEPHLGKAGGGYAYAGGVGTPSTQPATSIQTGVAQAAQVGNYFLARQMTRSQAADLYNSLKRDSAARQTELYEQVADDPVPAEAGAQEPRQQQAMGQRGAGQAQQNVYRRADLRQSALARPVDADKLRAAMATSGPTTQVLDNAVSAATAPSRSGNDAPVAEERLDVVIIVREAAQAPNAGPNAADRPPAAAEQIKK